MRHTRDVMPRTATPDVEPEVTNQLLAFLADQRDGIEPEALPLLDQVDALVRAGGKRLRPRLCALGYAAGGGEPGPGIVRIGAALELLHTFALILDDVMDASSMRRHRTTAAHELGTSGAVLAGLLGLVLADRLFDSAELPPDAMRRARERYDAMRLRTIAGQYLDVDAAASGSANEDVVRRIGVLKTAGYTVTDPLVIGAASAGAGAEVVSALAAFGTPLGEAFQIRDDILGAMGDPRATGKDRDGDLREGKQTMLLARARARASAEDAAFLDRAIGDRDLSPTDADRVRAIFRSTGAADDAAALADELTARALTALDASVLGAEVRAALSAIAAELSGRTS